MGVRRKARVCALQMLFQFDVAKPTATELIGSYWRELGGEMANDSREYANNLVVGTLAHLEEIDELIMRRAENWRLSRMAIVDRNILRLAIFEFLYQPDTPKTVAINEALEIARRFSTFEATQFINGILDGVKRDLETEPTASTATGKQS